MKISERTVKRLGEIITGDKGIPPYRGGPKLVSFFNECGTNHTNGQGFPSRWMFAEDCIRQFNDTPTMKNSLLRIRGKAESRLSLSQAEWTTRRLYEYRRFSG